MKYHLVLPCLAAISALLASTAYSVKVTGIYSDEATKTVFIDKKVFVLKCNVTDNTDGKTLQWKRVGTVLTDEFKGRNTTEQKGNVYSLKVTEATDKDIGNYSCEVGDQVVEFQVVTQIFVKVESYINVVEGESLKIRCDTRGNPPPKLSWRYVNDTFNATYEESTDRVTLSPFNNVENGELQIDNIQKYDRGVYTCIGRPAVAVDSDADVETVEKSCTVRVKDKYAALWPFLGICAEVFVLCLIIFIYEKKRNKTELEESDTDQSPDQKNTPDHGKESNLRHRQ